MLEENFGTELIERNKRRNGPIFTVLSEFDWNIYNSKLEVYNKDFWNKKENLLIPSKTDSKLLQEAIGHYQSAFELFTNGEIKLKTIKK